MQLAIDTTEPGDNHPSISDNVSEPLLTAVLYSGDRPLLPSGHLGGDLPANSTLMSAPVNAWQPGTGSWSGGLLPVSWRVCSFTMTVAQARTEITLVRPAITTGSRNWPPAAGLPGLRADAPRRSCGSVHRRPRRAGQHPDRRIGRRPAA